MAMIDRMGRAGAGSKGQHAETMLGELFARAGWRVVAGAGRVSADLLLKKRGVNYVVEVKSTSEARADRVVPLLSQAILQSRHHAQGMAGAKPLAIIFTPSQTSALRAHVDRFHDTFAPDVAVGLVSADGGVHFSDPALATLNTTGVLAPASRRAPVRRAHDLFSDLNQWLIKVLLAPEIPVTMLAAPRQRYRNVSELAGAAHVSVMTAFRCVSRLREEGFIDDADGALSLVRRRALFDRWHASAARTSPEVPARFAAPGAIEKQMKQIVARHEACAGLFTAADALGLGHVSGPLPYLQVRQVRVIARWREIDAIEGHEKPQLVIRQATAAESTFRGAIERDGLRFTDVIQTWLDVSAHPSRGEEQARHIERRVLDRVIGRTS